MDYVALLKVPPGTDRVSTKAALRVNEPTTPVELLNFTLRDNRNREAINKFENT